MASKYVDTTAVIQVIGGIYNNINLLDNDSYVFREEDFPNNFHRILFGSMYNLHLMGAKQINTNTIEDYLSQRPTLMSEYTANRGREYLENLSLNSQFSTFDYYYKRMKKMSLLRMYNEAGVDVSWLYDADNILDMKKKQIQEDWLDNTPIENIADLIDNKITEIRLKYVDNADEEAVNAGEGALELLQRLRETPEVGYPLFGKLVNTVHNGARLKKFYLRSGATGTGKTRTMIADACFIACDEIYDEEKGTWVNNGTKEPTSFISTEQELEEIQTMMIAFLSCVEEDHIVNNTYFAGEWERVCHAAEVLQNSPLYVQLLPDFSLQDIENTIKKGVRENGVRYVFNSKRVSKDNERLYA